MFLSDELERIFNEKGIAPGIGDALFKCCLERIEKSIKDCSNTSNVQSVLTELKRIDYTWRAFCRKHEEFKPDGFKNAFLKIQKPELAEKLKINLNW